MRGLLLVNNKNQVILVEGDNRFRSHLKGLLKRELCSHSDTASTSSGVFSDSSSGIFTEDKPSTSNPSSPASKSLHCSRKFCQSITVLSEITYHFLPIISIFRTAESLKDSYKSLNSDGSTILFESLSCDFLLIVITEGDETVARDWLRVSSEALKLHFGPLLESLDADLSVYDTAITQLGITLDHVTRHLPIKRDTNGYRAAAYYSKDTQKMIPMLKTLSERISETLGANRDGISRFSCLLVSHGELLCSVNSTSDEKKIWKHFDTTDINSLKRFFKLHPITANTQVNQLWLRSKNSETPFYADVMRYKLMDELEIVFVCAVSGCALIRMGAEVLDQLDNLIYENSDTLKTCIMVKKLCTALRSTTARSHCRTPTAFLRNPPKTADFIEVVWERILNEIRNLSNEANQNTSTSGSRSRSLSLLSIKSAFSILSMSTSMETCCGKEKLLPPKLETIIRYLRRQILSLVQELCSSAQADAISERLPTAHAIVARSLTRTHLMAIHKLKIGHEDRFNEMREHLKPATWRFDIADSNLRGFS
ncbi:unnamed protein product, partial [Mesorhabditis belari]|uniref:Uncharacterized protein n=1 Tax=Mesorhabditis belari TaxID=2138241 RepID=A0AAF3EA54_9BILA